MGDDISGDSIDEFSAASATPSGDPGADTTGGWFDPATSTFGDRVAGAREAAGMSQSDLAKRLGVKLATLRGWENDLSEPRANKLQMMAGLLNVSLAWLLNGLGEGVPEPGQEGALDADMLSLLTEMREMRTQMGQMSDRLGLLEKRLRSALRATG